MKEGRTRHSEGPVEMTQSSTIDKVFRPLYGKPSWQIQQGHGSFLTFEFGEPNPCIREPIRASELKRLAAKRLATVLSDWHLWKHLNWRILSLHVSAATQKLAAKRKVTIYGDWHLWIYLCDWRILSQGQVIAENESSRDVISKATQELDGQALTKVVVEPSSSCVFEFDLGGRLETLPNPRAYEDADEQWHLYEPSGDVFTLRSDGCYSHSPGNTTRDAEKWELLEIK